MSDATKCGVWDERHLRLAVDAAAIALMSWNVDTNLIEMDERGYALWGVPRRGGVTVEDLSENIHPEGRDRVRAAFAATRAVLGNYDIDFRIMLGTEVRWISARGQGSDAGISKRVMYGIFLDVSARKHAEEAHELLAGEMSHRVKNLLAIASGLTQITARSAKTTKAMAEEIIQRLTALGRAHELVRPAPGRDAKVALLGDLLAILLDPYADKDAFSGRIRVAAPRMAVGEAAATTLALVIHELATNAVKYGALSVEAGTLDVSCTAHDDEVMVIWTERGGPAVQPPTGSGGFGSALIRRSVASQLQGAIEYDWAAEGLVATLRAHRQRLSDQARRSTPVRPATTGRWQGRSAQAPTAISASRASLPMRSSLSAFRAVLEQIACGAGQTRLPPPRPPVLGRVVQLMAAPAQGRGVAASVMPAPWPRSVVAGATRVTGKGGAASMIGRAGLYAPGTSGGGRRRRTQPRPSRQAPRSASHHLPSPRCTTVCPCGRAQRSQTPAARPSRISGDNPRQSIA